MTDLRKLMHGSAVLVPILIEVTSKPIVLTGLCIIMVVYSVEEVLRLKRHPMPVLTRFTLRMSRPSETEHFIVSPVYLGVGIILALLLFPTKIAYASIIIVATGDPVAAYVGGRFGRRHIRQNKTLVGLLAGLVVSFLLASILVYPLAAFAGAAGAMLMELLAFPDDNLTMPIAAGALIFLMTLATQ